MAIQNIQRWEWMLAALIAGFGVGYLQQLPAEDWQKAFGKPISQEQFEEGLLNEQSGLRWFRNLVVYRQTVELGGRTIPVHIVAGDYFNGKLEMQDGKKCAVWRPACYIARIPHAPLAARAGLASDASVMAYLDTLQSSGVAYTHAWWRDARWSVVLWMAGSVLIIGVIWPSVINVLVFGSIFRPAEQKGMDLSKVRSTSAAGERKPQVTDADLEQIVKLSESLEGELATGALSAAPGTPGPRRPVPVRVLAARKLELAAEEKARQEKEFGQKKDDFYPTERQTHPHKPT